MTRMPLSIAGASSRVRACTRPCKGRRQARFQAVNPPTTIERARAEDWVPVLDLLRRAQLPTDGLDPDAALLLVARRAGRVVGSAALEVYGSGGLLRSVAVEPALRGDGLGRRLTAAALAAARARSLKTVYLLTTTAGDFFPRCGFRRIERADVDPAVQASVEFTTACPASALVMAHDLAPDP